MSGFINKIQYVALQMMIAGHLNYKVGKFCHLTQNLHIYNRHNNAVNEILDRTPIDIQPQIKLIDNKNFYDYTINDFEIIDNVGKKLESPLELAI
jgi:thymidylate synthase